MTSNRTHRPPRNPGARERHPLPRWRRQLDSFGGPLVVGGFALAIVALLLLAIRTRPTVVSDAALLGDPVSLTPASHITDPAQLVVPPGEPPAGGPHFAQPQPPGTYDQPVADGNAVHSLEHGMVWISYQPELLRPGEQDVLVKVANAYRNDVVLSPRPANSQPVSIVSWGRRMNVPSPVEEGVLRTFVERNRNRSPEPGVR